MERLAASDQQKQNNYTYRREFGMNGEQIQRDLNRIWNGWKIQGLIGKGSYGKVYKITKRDAFDRCYEAALKVITIPQSREEIQSVENDGMSRESVREYFHAIARDIAEEVSFMSRLKGNSHIVSYEDHAIVARKGTIEWDIYIRMELLVPLFDDRKKHPMTVERVIQLGIDLCRALETCQQHQIIHRDIKPENIFVSHMGHFKLGDFGIARRMEKTVSLLSKKGTYTYMAPEVYLGRNCDFRGDIYSLGIVLYRFLNHNRTPFLPPYPENIHYSDRDQAIYLRMGGQRIPAPCNGPKGLKEIVEKACAYNPEERYQSAARMREDLEYLLYGRKEELAVALEEELLPADVDENSADQSMERPLGELEKEEKQNETVYLFPRDEEESYGQEPTQKQPGNRRKGQAEGDSPPKGAIRNRFFHKKKMVWIVLFLTVVIGGAIFYQTVKEKYQENTMEEEIDSWESWEIVN